MEKTSFIPICTSSQHSFSLLVLLHQPVLSYYMSKINTLICVHRYAVCKSHFFFENYHLHLCDLSKSIRMVSEYIKVLCL